MAQRTSPVRSMRMAKCHNGVPNGLPNIRSGYSRQLWVLLLALIRYASIAICFNQWDVLQMLLMIDN